MALSTFDEAYSEVLLACPLAGPVLARRWVRNAFRNVAERRRWSWLLKRSQFLFYDAYKTGTVAVTFDSPTVTGTSTVWTSAHVGREFRVGVSSPVYTISAVDAGLQTLTLDQNYGGVSATGVGYEIYKAYQTVPTDFKSFITVIDPQNNWRLRINILTTELDAIDPQRSNSGNPRAVVGHIYDTTSTPPLARYEFWPHRKSQAVYPFIYESQLSDLDDANASLPRPLRGEVLVRIALSEAARWPGPSYDKPNPYFSLHLALMLTQEANDMVFTLERQDDEMYTQDLQYQHWNSMPFSDDLFIDAAWLQKHV